VDDELAPVDIDSSRSGDDALQQPPVTDQLAQYTDTSTASADQEVAGSALLDDEPISKSEAIQRLMGEQVSSQPQQPQAEMHSQEQESSADSSPNPETSSEEQSLSLTELRSQSAEAAPGTQGELPFAVVQGKAVTEIPQDLYIPPDALEVFLDAFEGPLDLLLYLIKRQNLDILDINVAEITQQYMSYVNMMSAMQFELAAEYLLMAAMLAEIKSRLLLPRSAEVEEDEEDPRAQLIRRLQEYERFKQAAEEIDEMPRMSRDLFQARAEPPEFESTIPLPDIEMKELMTALADVLRRAEMFESHHVQREKLSTRERMSQVLSTLSADSFTPFVSLFDVKEGKLGVVVTFLAIMELIKESLVELVQNESFGAIHVKARSSSAAE